MKSIPESDEPEVPNQDVETPSEPLMAPQSPSPVPLHIILIKSDDSSSLHNHALNLLY